MRAKDAGAVKILLLEDSDLDAKLIERELYRAELNFVLTRVGDRGGFVEALAAAEYDIILCDFSLPDIDGLGALALAHRAAAETPFIFVSGVLGEEVAIESLKEGATDYLLKQRLERLPSAVSRALNEAYERRERRRAEARMTLLVAELSHRVKNTMATVTAMARLTLRQSHDLPTFEQAFMSRLQAMAEAHTLVFESNWGETDLHRVMDRALNPFIRRDGRIHVEGEAVRLPPKFALTLALMLHELATNAVKYGALSTASGQVHVNWTLLPGSDPAMVRLTWTESGGPPVRPPTRKGFGHTLIERGARYELEGDAALSFAETGVTAALTFCTGSGEGVQGRREAPSPETVRL